MTDLSKGIIEIEGVTLSKDTTISDLARIDNPNIVIKRTPRGHNYVKFLNPITSDDVDMYVEVLFYVDEKEPKITLFPSVNSDEDTSITVSEHRLQASRKWLRSMISEAPVTDCKEGIGYIFDDCKVMAFIQRDPFYGYVGGEVRVLWFTEEDVV
jgi:hypothetical protein